MKIVDLMQSDDDFFKSIYDGHIDYSKFDVVRVGKGRPEEEICELVRDADILMSDPFHHLDVTKKIIEAGKELRLIQCHTVGYDDVDIVTARERGIPVANSAGIAAKPMAEYTIMAALYFLRTIKYADEELRNGRWAQEEITTQPHLIPQEFGSKTLGIVGYGNIGREVARIARTFGTKILYHKRSRLSEEMEGELGIKYASFEDLISSSDVLSVNVPLTDETRGMIGEEEIAMRKQGAILINTSRGGIVDEEALAIALKEGKLRGAAVDVFKNEPIDYDCPLLGLQNVILTPHISAVSPDMMKRVPVMVCENLNRIYEGKKPLRVVN